jgi:hypothetical protein
MGSLQHNTNPHDKELNIGKQIAVWQVLVGLCIVANEKKSAIISGAETKINK